MVGTRRADIVGGIVVVIQDGRSELVEGEVWEALWNI